MRAVVCHELGPPSTLRIDERPSPEAGPGQVVVDVEAAGVNFVDALFVSGQYQIKPALPFVPGSEIAGTVSAVGNGVDSVTIGDRVMASCGLGGFAEQIALAATGVTQIPERLGAGQAATFTQSYATALFALRDRGRLATGETVLVLGAGGGVGLATIDVARALGAHTIAAASSPAKREAASEMGAEATIDTTSESLKDRGRALAALLGAPDASRTGVDVVVDPIGGDLADGALRALGNGGRFLVIGFASGSIPSLPLNQVLLRNRQIVGVDWGAWAMGHPAAQEALITELFDLVSADRLRPTEPATYPLERVGDALDDLLGRRVVGKVALVV